MVSKGQMRGLAGEEESRQSSHPQGWKLKKEMHRLGFYRRKLMPLCYGNMAIVKTKLEEGERKTNKM